MFPMGSIKETVMKGWKKVTSMLVAATMVGSFAACGDKGGDKLDNTQLSQNYAATLSDALENTKSVKITAQATVLQSEAYNGSIKKNEAALTMEAVISEDDEGYSLGLKAIAQENGEKAVAEMILKGQYMYSRTYEEGDEDAMWSKEDLGFPIDVEVIVEEYMDFPWATVEELLASQEISDIKAQAQEAFATSLYQQLEAGKAQDGVVSVSVDFKNFFNGWVNYLNGIDESKTTLEQFFNATALKAGFVISYEEVLNGLSAFANKTVGEAVEILEAYAQDNYNKTLQQLKDDLMQSEFAEVLFVDVLQLTNEEIDEIKALQIADLIGEVEQMTVAEFIDAMATATEPDVEVKPMSEEAPEVDGEENETETESFVQSMLAQMAAMKNATLEELGLSVQELPYRVDALAFKGSVSFNEDGTDLMGISFGGDVDLYRTFDAAQERWVRLAVSFQFEVSSFSKSTVAINAPAADQIGSGSVEME